EEAEAVGPSGGETVAEEPAPAPPSDTGEATKGTTGEGADLPIANPEAEDLVAVPPESCPGANVVLEPFGTNGGAQSEPFEVTGGTFVVRVDLKSDNPDDARLDVSILDTETQKPVEEFDQRAVGSYGTTISQGPGSYLLNLQPKASSYEITVFDCADQAPEQKPEQKPEQGSGEDAPGAPLELESSPPPEVPPAPQSGGSEAPVDQPAEFEFAADDEPVSPEDDASPSDVDLPTQEGQSGEVAVLPDTGGPGLDTSRLLIVVAGALAVAAGVAGLAVSVGSARGPGGRSGTDGR
ncbi:MAG: hypothetical protein WA982_18005, partial [Rubrobacteraceae bacterium]